MLHCCSRLTILGLFVLSLVPMLMGQGCPAPTGEGPSSPLGGDSGDGGSGGSGSGSPSLEGTWSGVVAVTIKSDSSTTGPANINDPGATSIYSESSVTVTFGENGVPSSLPVFGVASTGTTTTGQATALQVGQASTVVVNGITMTVLVKEATYSKTYVRVVLDVSMSSQQTSSGIVVAMAAQSIQTFEFKLSADGKNLSWLANNDAASSATASVGGQIIEGRWIAQLVQQVGDLVRQ